MIELFSFVFILPITVVLLVMLIAIHVRKHNVAKYRRAINNTCVSNYCNCSKVVDTEDTTK